MKQTQDKRSSLLANSARSHAAVIGIAVSMSFVAIVFFSEIILSREAATPIKPAAIVAFKGCLPFLAIGLIFVVVRYVSPTSIRIMNFLLPLVLLAVLAYAAHRLYKSNLVYRFGLIWLSVPLMFVLDPRIFTSEMLYLKATEGNGDPQIRRLHELATQGLQQLKK